VNAELLANSGLFCVGEINSGSLKLTINYIWKITEKVKHYYKFTEVFERKRGSCRVFRTLVGKLLI
jgi:hypothetical protein